MDKKLRILLADANDDFRSGIAEQISSDAELELCGSTKSGSEALSLAQQLEPDVAEEAWRKFSKKRDQ